MEGLWIAFNKVVIYYRQDSVVSVIVLILSCGVAKGSGLLLRFWSEHLSFGFQDLSIYYQGLSVSLRFMKYSSGL